MCSVSIRMLALYIHLIFGTFAVVSTTGCLSQRYDKIHTCTDPTSTSYTQSTVSSNAECSAQCSRNNDCLSFSVRASPETRTCYLHRSLFVDTGCSNGDVHFALVIDSPVCLNGGVYDNPTDICRCVNSYVGSRCERLMEDCIDGAESGHYTGMTEVFMIYPRLATQPFQVSCQMTDGKIYILRRKNLEAVVNFSRGWNDYRDGFGDFLTNNYWLGLEKMHLITSSSRNYWLVVTGYFADMPSVHRQHMYETFKVLSASSGYSFTSTSHKPNYAQSGLHELYDCMWELQGQPFSTIDNDASSGNCATTYMSGWWFKNCSLCNPTGVIQTGPETVASSDPKLMFWPMSGGYAAKELAVHLVT